MRVGGLVPDLDHFRVRVLADAFAEAQGDYWEGRARALEWACPRPGDFRGRASEADLRRAWERCRSAAAACREHARLFRRGDPVPALVACVVGEVA